MVGNWWGVGFGGTEFEALRKWRFREVDRKGPFLGTSSSLILNSNIGQ